jgi:helicase
MNKNSRTRTTKLKFNKDPVLALCEDTVAKKKQALVFCNSKRSTEAQAEKMIKQQAFGNNELRSLAQEIRSVLANPTKQCERLARCVEKGIAFHHSGLPAKQRELIERSFKERKINIIFSTPTLAIGIDLPAFRAIIKDYRRFTNKGLKPIPVLEFEQMTGRAGRPGMESFGEALLIAQQEEESEFLLEHYINGEVEPIYSKLAVEPVLRTYILSLVSTGITSTTKEVFDFFDKTFYAHQFEDRKKLHLTLIRMLRNLVEWKMIFFPEEIVLSEESPPNNNSEKDPSIDQLFQSAEKILHTKTIFLSDSNLNSKIEVSPLGKRVSEMYLDPLTANYLIKGLRNFSEQSTPEQEKKYIFQLVHLVSCSLEMRPLLRAKTIDEEMLSSMRDEDTLLSEEDVYLFHEEDFDNTLKTSKFFIDWMNEFDEEYFLERYDVRPGEIVYKQERANWLLYACEELSRIEGLIPIMKYIKKTRLRIKHGVKEELLPLLRFKGVGRVRSRKLFDKGVRTTKDVEDIPFGVLVEIVGVKLAKSMKEEVGKKVSEDDFTNLVFKARKQHSAQTNLEEFWK